MTRLTKQQQADRDSAMAALKCMGKVKRLLARRHAERGNMTVPGWDFKVVKRWYRMYGSEL